MSAPMKRHALNNVEAIPTKHSYTDVQDDKLKSFIAWANYRHFNLNHKVRINLLASSFNVLHNFRVFCKAIACLFV